MPDAAPIELADIRTDYRRGKLRRTDLHKGPIEQFNCWLKNACDAGIPEPTAMSLATAGGANRLHDRFEYTREPDGLWRLDRRAP